MPRTYHPFVNTNPKKHYRYKNTRKYNKKLGRHAHKTNRNYNRNANQITFMTFNSSIASRFYGRSFQPSGQLIGNRYQVSHYLNKQLYLDKSSKTQVEKLSVKIRELLHRQENYNFNLGGSHRKSRRVSDLYIAAYKQLKRRGTIAPFRGHKEKSQLYKRELQFYEQQINN